MANESKQIKLTVNFNEEFEGKVFSWTTHPMKKRPLAAAIVTAFILIVSMLVFYSTSSKGFTTLALIILFANLAKFYLPTKFKLTKEFVLIKSTTQTIARRWIDLRSFYPDKNGVLVSPFGHPSRLENFRGIYLIFNDNRTEVIEFIKSHINSAPETEAKPITEGENEESK